MGRTVPTFTNLIQEEAASWAKFRRGLRRDDQEIFDDLFRAPRKHLAASAYTVRSMPFESMIMAMLLEEHKLVLQLKARIEQLVVTNEHHQELASDHSGLAV
jgi:hypothetical protein